MTDVLTRYGSDLEVRAAQRTIYGLAVPFDTPADIVDAWGSYREVFDPGSFTRTIRERGSKVKLLANHDQRRFPIGRATLLREDAAGLYAEFKVAQTRDGDEVLELVADGVLDGLSVGFAPIRDREADGVIHRVEVRLNEVSAVAFPAYETAAIAGVRSMQKTADMAATFARLKELDPTR